MFTTVDQINREWRRAATMAPMDADVKTRCEWVMNNKPDYVSAQWVDSTVNGRIFEMVFSDYFSSGIIDFINVVFPDVCRNSMSYGDDNTWHFSCKANVFVDNTENPTYTDCGSIA